MHSFRSPLRRGAVASAVVLALAAPVLGRRRRSILPAHAGLKDLDARTGRVTATAAQKQAVSASARARSGIATARLHR